MNRSIKAMVLGVVVSGLVGSASLAHADKPRSTVERRQHPGRGFWESSPQNHVQKHHVQKHASTHTLFQGRPLFWNLSRLWQVDRTPVVRQSATRSSSKSSWRWNRGSRAQFYSGSRRAAGGR